VETLSKIKALCNQSKDIIMTSSTPMNDTILVFETEGRVAHRFCPEAEAREHVLKAPDANSGGSMFTAEGGNAELHYSVSPDLRSRVADAKAKLARGIQIRDTLTRHGVPMDRELRGRIVKAFRELNSATLA
jgi:hypothetical protein